MATDVPQERTIRIGKVNVGLLGFDYALNLVLQQENISDTEAMHFLYETVKKQNYIPPGSEELYKEALRNEYLRAKNQSGKTMQELTIRVLGKPCVSCSKLGTIAIEVLQKMNIAADVENIHDPDEIYRFGIINAPALIINNQVKCAGRLPSESEVEQWIKDALDGNG